MDKHDSRVHHVCGRALVVLLAVLGGGFPAAAVAAAPAGAVMAGGAPAAAPPLGIDLNAFDASKKTVALPNGETLAYVDMGAPSGPAVVLIHGYTDNAR